jgi:glycosyltransferase involved in cell wall biosynthesis
MRTVLNISKHDAIGRRFNNLDARSGFSEFSWNAKFCCWSSRTESAEYVQQAGSSITKQLTPWLAKLGRETGNLNGYYRNSSAITNLPFYEAADLLHFHIVHEEYLSLADWKRVAGQKPVVWTWHDPYMLSGHCIYSLDCNGFETGCKSCPHLDYHFAIRKDRSEKNLAEKKAAVLQIDPLVVVASDYMLDRIDRSVYSKAIRVRKIAFGVDFQEPMSKYDARVKLAIEPQGIVIGFRAVYSEYKGMSLIQEALSRLASRYPNLPITVVAFQEKGCCTGFANQFHVVETGWVADHEIESYFAAMDFFLMPSKAEAFGMMAIEALAAGAMPIVTAGTALQSLIGAPKYGLCADHNDDSFSQVLEQAVMQVARISLGRNERIQFARQHYSIQRFCRELAETYDQEIEYSNSHRRSA